MSASLTYILSPPSARYYSSESLLGDEHCGRLDRRVRRRLRVRRMQARAGNPYPASIEDCYTGLKWVGESLAELQIDPERLTMSGMSAEGGPATSLALPVRDRGGPATVPSFSCVLC